VSVTAISTPPAECPLCDWTPNQSDKCQVCEGRGSTFGAIGATGPEGATVMCEICLGSGVKDQLLRHLYWAHLPTDYARRIWELERALAVTL
jgi:hypothetical protein